MRKVCVRWINDDRVKPMTASKTCFFSYLFYVESVYAVTRSCYKIFIVLFLCLSHCLPFCFFCVVINFDHNTIDIVRGNVNGWCSYRWRTYWLLVFFSVRIDRFAKQSQAEPRQWNVNNKKRQQIKSHVVQSQSRKVSVYVSVWECEKFPMKMENNDRCAPGVYVTCVWVQNVYYVMGYGEYVRMWRYMDERKFMVTSIVKSIACAVCIKYVDFSHSHICANERERVICASA